MTREKLGSALVVASVLIGSGGIYALAQPLSRAEIEAQLADHEARISALEGSTTTSSTTTTNPVTTTSTISTSTTTTTTTIPTTTTAPSACVGVQVTAGSGLGSAMSAAPAGTTFCLGAGIFLISAALPFQSNDKVIGARGPTGERLSILSGGGTTSYLVTATNSGVLIQGLVIERFANASQQGVNTGAQTAWTWDDLEVRENAGHGIHTHDDSKVTNSWIHHNHQAGLGGSGDRVLIEGNLIEWNNYLGEFDWGFEAGGSKWVNAAGLIVRNNVSRNNCGPGLWTDGTGNVGITYQNNVVTDNHGPGIMHEIGGAAVIVGNTASGNAFGNARSSTSCVSPGTTGGFGGGILISDSRDTEAFGNTLSDNDGGIVVINDARGTGIHPVNLNIHDNDITNAAGGYHAAGCKDNEAGSICYDAASNNHWDGNDYHTADSTPFEWLDAERTWAAWQGFGFDLAGACCG